MTIFCKFLYLTLQVSKLFWFKDLLMSKKLKIEVTLKHLLQIQRLMCLQQQIWLYYLCGIFDSEMARLIWLQKILMLLLRNIWRKNRGQQSQTTVDMCKWALWRQLSKNYAWFQIFKDKQGYFSSVVLVGLNWNILGKFVKSSINLR